MWISRKLSDHRRFEQEGAAADMGVTTIGGSTAAVMTRGEQRNLEVFSPGGLIWQPTEGDTVLVVKGGCGAQEQCITAMLHEGRTPEGMQPGEVCLYSLGGASLVLRNDGSIRVVGPVRMEGDLQVEGHVELIGRVDIEGELYVNGIPYRPCVCV